MGPGPAFAQGWRAIAQHQCRRGIVQPVLPAQILFERLDRSLVIQIADGKAADDQIIDHVDQRQGAATGQFGQPRHIEAIGQIPGFVIPADQWPLAIAAGAGQRTIAGPMARALIWRGLWREALAVLPRPCKVFGKVRLNPADARLLRNTVGKRMGAKRVLFLAVGLILRSLGLEPIEVVFSAFLK